MAYAYSASTNAFYDLDLESDYVASGKWPSDATTVSDSTFLSFGCTNPPQGKMRAPGADGVPSWVDLPAPTAAETFASLQADASTALSESDRVVLRCYEDGIAVPSDWVAYRRDLRALIAVTSVDSTLTMPSKPAYPPGT